MLTTKHANKFGSILIILAVINTLAMIIIQLLK